MVSRKRKKKNRIRNKIRIMKDVWDNLSPEAQKRIYKFVEVIDNEVKEDESTS